MSNLIVIPVRLESTRLPGKALLEVGGKTILQHTYEQCCKSKVADEVAIVTEDKEIEYGFRQEKYKYIDDAIYHTEYGGSNIRCGTERVIWALTDKLTLDLDDFDKVVSVQVDYPEIDYRLIDCVFEHLVPVRPIVSAYYGKKKLEKDDVGCSVSSDGTLYNFRRDSREPKVHVGIYGFTNKIIHTLQLIYEADKRESYDLEQTLWLNYGLSIHGLLTLPTRSINNQEDLDKFASQYQPK